MRTPLGSSPHTRGAPAPGFSIRPGAGIIPAYAGSTGVLDGRPRRLADHPRIRGEHGSIGQSGALDRGSSPHTRGALLDDRICGVVPVDHPRIRGEHGRYHHFSLDRGGSSPHTRGAREASLTTDRRTRIIPAYAGSTLGNPCNTKDRRRDYTSFPLPVTHPSGGGGS